MDPSVAQTKRRSEQGRSRKLASSCRERRSTLWNFAHACQDRSGGGVGKWLAHLLLLFPFFFPSRVGFRVFSGLSQPCGRSRVVQEGHRTIGRQSRRLILGFKMRESRVIRVRNTFPFSDWVSSLRQSSSSASQLLRGQPAQPARQLGSVVIYLSLYSP